jgi:hypothetical protein
VVLVCIARPILAWGLLAAALAGLLVSSAGCGNVQPGMLRWDDGSAASSLRVVIAPLNLAVRLAPDLEEAVEPVEAEMIRYFQAHGARVAVIWPADARWLWRDSTAASQGSESPALDLKMAADLETAAGAFVRALDEHADFDLLVMPSLVYREARVTGRHAHWDGVRRRLTVHTPMASGENLHTTDWSGRIAALSLHTLVFTPEGRRVFHGWGGIDLVHDAVLVKRGSSDRSFLRLQQQLIENPEHVREGVGLALQQDLFTRPE